MNAEDLEKELLEHGRDIRKACVDIANRTDETVPAKNIKSYSRKQGSLTDTQKALFKMYITVLILEKELAILEKELAHVRR